MSARSLPVVCFRGGLDSRERFANFLPLKISTHILLIVLNTFPYDTEKKNLLKNQKLP